MLNYRRRLLIKLFKLSDVFILTASLLFSSWIISSPGNLITVEELLSLRFSVINYIGFLGAVFIWHLIFNSFNLYHSRRLDMNCMEIIGIIKATTTGTVIFMLLGFITGAYVLVPLGIGVLWFSSTMCTIMFRLGLRFMLRKIRLYGRNLRFVLIVGTNNKAYEFARMIEKKQEIGFRVIGYLDENIYQPNEGMNLLGGLDDFSRVIKDYIVDEVVITLPVKSYYEEIHNIVHKAEEQGISVRYFSKIFDTKVAHSRAEKIEQFSVLTIDSGYQESCQYAAKRAIDIVLGLVLIVILSPVMLLTIAAIKLLSAGPVLFIQDRVGYNKRIFRIYKFRTMVVGAEKQQAALEDQNELAGPVFKICKDPRITGIGHWLRKLSIDELPQLFNVIRGDMSLVGPRPLPVRDYSGFSNNWQCRRFSVLPGLTCTWQVNGRNNIPFEDWMKMDMEYIDNWKLADDIKILVKTVPAIVRGKGAA